MEKKQLVLNALKPKVKAFGFDKKEVESIAATIADKLELDENASEEDVQTAIETAVDAAVPFLAVSQQAVTRIVNAKGKHDEPKDDPNPNDPPKDDPKDDDMPAYMKAFMDAQKASMDELKAELSAMKAEKAATGRKARLEEMLKDTGAFGKATLRQFERMTFSDDDAFDAFVEEVKEDLKNLNQERADAGLSALGNPPSAGGKGEEKEPEVFTDEQLAEIAGTAQDPKK
jgi:hypothetical protein